MTKTMIDIFNAMKDKGLSQKKFSELVGVTEVSMSRYIHGQRNPDIDLVEKMAEVLECEIIVEKGYKGKKDVIACPWCGEIPNEYQTPHGGYYLECENYACPVQPQSQIFRTREKMIRRWNECGTNADSKGCQMPTA